MAYPRWPVAKSDQRATSEFTSTTNTVLDHSTCLMWQRNADQTERNWAGAAQFCDGLVLDGLNDWRLPTRAELLSIADFSAGTPPAINQTVFPATVGGTNRFWSGTPTAWDASRYWVVLHGGIAQTTYMLAGDLGRVRCVRGAGAPSGARFDTSTNFVVKDKETGLLWEAAPPDSDFAYSQASAYCDALTTAGFADWRLPSVRELLTLPDPTLSTPALPSPAFTAQSKWYWSSSPLNSFHRAVDFWTGRHDIPPPVDGGPATDYPTPRVRCVR
ncbi:MAG: DUF1566 domain-containing protein [Myxococcales bacterium]|nr:DUF1566 domain-containing protein [Myxococcales bacterium]